MIKFLDIYKQDKILHSKFIKKIKKNFVKSDYILGKAVYDFEKDFTKFCSIKYAVSCANGTDALYLSLKCLNLPKNSEVLVPALTWISSVSSIINAGLKPVLVDVDMDNGLISLEKLKKRINSRTKVILPVHLYGNVVDILSIKKIINKKKIFIIEDAAQAHGAKDINDNHIGSFSDLSCFSFYPGKNLGCYGDGGMIITNNKKHFLKLRKLRNMGQEVKNKHTEIGFNSRLDTIQAVLLSMKLKRLNYQNNKRKKLAKLYDFNLTNKKIIKIKYSKNSVYHQYVIMIKNRKKLSKILSSKNIQYGIHYPTSINKIDCFKKIFKGKKFINAETIAQKCLSLPIDPNLSISSLRKICNILNRF